MNFFFSFEADTYNDPIFVPELKYSDFKSLLKIVINKDYIALDNFLETYCGLTVDNSLTVKDKLILLIELKEMFISNGLTLKTENGQYSIDLDNLKKNLKSFRTTEDGCSIKKDNTDFNFFLPTKLADLYNRLDPLLFFTFALTNENLLYRTWYNSNQSFEFFKNSFTTEDLKKVKTYSDKVQTDFVFEVHPYLDYKIDLGPNLLKFIEFLLSEDYFELLSTEFHLKKNFNYSLNELNTMTYQEIRLLFRLIQKDAQKEQQRKEQENLKTKIPGML